MQYRTLDRTGVQASSFVLGAMNFGKLGGATQDEVTAIVDHINRERAGRKSFL